MTSDRLLSSCVLTCVVAVIAMGINMHAGQRVADAGGLRIVVIEGEDAVNVIQQKTAVAPVIEVRDRNNQPVAGAVVNFAIRGGRATFGAARTLTVTTNVAGRAVATGLTPTASGAVQITASAAFQGQAAAAITIVQTNVVTAAEAAAAASSAGGASGGTAASTAGAGGAGAGGGISATTIGIIGAGVAGGALVATKALGEPAGTAYTAQFSGQIVVTGPAPFCGFTNPVSGGILVIRLDDNHTSGTAEVDEDIATVYSPACGGLPNLPAFHAHMEPQPLSSSGGGLAFNFQRDNTFTPSNGTPLVRTWSLSFSGALNGAEIVGVLTHGESNRNTSGPPLPASGSTAFPLTLR